MRKAFTAIAASTVSQYWPMAFGTDDGNNEAEGTGNDEGSDDEDEGDAEAAAEAEARAEAESIEKQARAQGWRPESEFKGKGNGKWVDAATFVQRGSEYKKKLERDVEVVKSELAEQKKTNAQLAKFYKEALDRKEAELTEAIRKARLDHKEAIRNGEDDDALTLEDRIETLKEEKAQLKKEPEPVAKKEGEDTPEAAAAKAAAEQQVLEDWIADGNEWFRDDHKLRAYAMAIGQEMRVAGDKSKDKAFLDRIRVQIEEEMPEKFAKGNPLRKKPGSVESGGAGVQQKQGKTARDLPKQDRALMEKFVKDGLMTEDQFLKEYNW